MLPTPIEKLKGLTKVPDDYKIFVKRDDLTGFGLSGNKVRKLEFLTYEALKKRCDTLITCGGIQSNHARATAIVAAQLGLKSFLVLFDEEKPKDDGNLFLSRLVGAELKYITSEEYEWVDDIMEQERVRLKSKGREGYVIPEGGSNALGIWGYIKAAQEIKSQLDSMKLKIDRIITAVSSGGTYSGLYIGSKLLKWKVKITGFNIRETSAIAVERIWKLVQSHLKRFKLDIPVSKEELVVIDGYVGKGYGLSREVELDLMKSVAKDTGIILDPVYSGKAMLGFVDQIKKRRFSKKEKSLFLHTGGGFGLFPIKEKFFK
jgi:D-cysteine desulfhydrase